MSLDAIERACEDYAMLCDAPRRVDTTGWRHVTPWPMVAAMLMQHGVTQSQMAIELGAVKSQATWWKRRGHVLRPIGEVERAIRRVRYGTNGNDGVCMAGCGGGAATALDRDAGFGYCHGGCSEDAPAVEGVGMCAIHV
jgi:hypothetical protein